MSLIGKKPIPLPKGVTVKIAGDAVEVQGPKGKMRQALPPGIVFAQDTSAEGAGVLVAKLEREDPQLGGDGVGDGGPALGRARRRVGARRGARGGTGKAQRRVLSGGV